MHIFQTTCYHHPQPQQMLCNWKVWTDISLSANASGRSETQADNRMRNGHSACTQPPHPQSPMKKSLLTVKERTWKKPHNSKWLQNFEGRSSVETKMDYNITKVQNFCNNITAQQELWLFPFMHLIHFKVSCFIPGADTKWSGNNNAFVMDKTHFITLNCYCYVYKTLGLDSKPE